MNQSNIKLKIKKKVYCYKFKQMKNILLIISRIFVGGIFIFSGFVKSVDVLGSEYKFTDYFTAFGWDWAIPLALPLAFLLSNLEFIVGVAVLLGFCRKMSYSFALLFMIIFTPLTLYIALKNPVTDCGCFGDALVITNWQTFWKNIIILFPVIYLFLNRKKRPKRKIKVEVLSFAITGLLIFFFSFYNYSHLPIIDFRPYKIGTYIPDKMIMPDNAPVDEYIYNYTLKNTKTNKTKEMDSNEYLKSNIWQDTTWQIIKTSDPILVKEGYHPPIHDFTITSRDGYEITDSVLYSDNYYLLLIMYRIDRADLGETKQINKLYEYCQQNNYKFIALTASVDNDIEQYKEKTNAKYDFYITDEITLKTIIRSNPGLVLIHKGTVLGKWHYNDLPDIKELKKYLKN